MYFYGSVDRNNTTNMYDKIKASKYYLVTCSTTNASGNNTRK